MTRKIPRPLAQPPQKRMEPKSTANQNCSHSKAWSPLNAGAHKLRPAKSQPPKGKDAQSTGISKTQAATKKRETIQSTATPKVEVPRSNAASEVQPPRSIASSNRTSILERSHPKSPCTKSKPKCAATPEHSHPKSPQVHTTRGMSHARAQLPQKRSNPGVRPLESSDIQGHGHPKAMPLCHPKKTATLAHDCYNKRRHTKE